MIAIDLSTYPIGVEPGSARVWIAPSWAAGFTLRPDLIPTHSTFASGGEVSTATLEYRFGRVLLPGSTAFANLAEITARGYWVLIEWINEGGSVTPWLGFAEAPVTLERYHGDDETPAGGLQSIPCYGLERALSQAWITSTVHKTHSGEPARKPLGSTFNASPTHGNKTSADGYPIEVFANPSDPGEFWSTRDIVEHLFAYHLPTVGGLPGSIPWAVDNLAGLPTWDKPELKTNDRTVADCLNELLSPNRLLGWKIEPTISPSSTFTASAPTVSSVKVVPYSLSPTPVTLPSVGSLAANPVVYSISTGGDPLTEIVNSSVDSIDMVDQLIVRGPREVSVCSIKHTDQGGPLEDGWTAEEKGDYDTGGADGLEFYTNLKQFEQRERNERKRRQGKSVDVYSLLKIKSDWGGTDGTVSVFYTPEGGENHDPYLGNVEILDELPLYREIDYEGELEGKDESEGRQRMPPVLLLRDPLSATKYHDPTGELNLDLGFHSRDGGKIPFVVELKPDNDRGPAIRLKVSGAPAHAIAPDFEGNEADVDDVFGSYDYKKILATVAIKSDRRASYAIPATISPAPDVVRQKIISLDHPSLELVNVAGGTVVGLNDDGTVKTTSGGLLRNPFPLLGALATLAATRQLQPKHSVEIATARRLPIVPGAILETLNGETVSSVIREVSIKAETARDGRGLKIRQTIKASTAAVDILALMRAAR